MLNEQAVLGSERGEKKRDRAELSVVRVYMY